MEPPETLAARIFLLAYDPGRGRLAAGHHLGLALRAAALVDLLRLGLIREDGGHVVAGHPGQLGRSGHPDHHAGDPLPAVVLDEIAASGRLDTGRQVARLDQRDVDLTALVAAGNVRTVLSWSARRKHRVRLGQLVARAGPVVPALSRAVRSADAAAASG